MNTTSALDDNMICGSSLEGPLSGKTSHPQISQEAAGTMLAQIFTGSPLSGPLLICSLGGTFMTPHSTYSACVCVCVGLCVCVCVRVCGGKGGN